ncbi:Leucine-rich repeat-containing N-terminal, plant-type [Dillenia turbinata]|uniref:Leucine-rich repeat-containing N-terminal, plant-type n=1 Tax=Dillenia turbinata TaxID=194707 RepID=A0AAN8W5Q8_9MAGN
MVTKNRGLYVVVWISIWLLSISVSYCAQTDVDCLKSIKESVLDPYRHLNSSWNFQNSTEGFICQFTGIDCWRPDENKVLNIRLSDMGLKGCFPRGIKNCSSLTGLDLSNNQFYGEIPSDISAIVSYVISLDLSHKKFTGEIPAEISNCTYLNTLKLDSNRLSGQIPLQLGSLRRLKTFSVANNLLTGQVPTFAGLNVSADSYANNPGLCGGPLEACSGTSKSSHTAIMAGAAAVGGMTIGVLGVGIGMLFYFRKDSSVAELTLVGPAQNDEGVKATGGVVAPNPLLAIKGLVGWDAGIKIIAPDAEEASVEDINMRRVVEIQQDYEHRNQELSERLRQAKDVICKAGLEEGLAGGASGGDPERLD